MTLTRACRRETILFILLALNLREASLALSPRAARRIAHRIAVTRWLEPSQAALSCRTSRGRIVRGCVFGLPAGTRRHCEVCHRPSC